MTNLIAWLKGFLSSGAGDASSKRLLIVVSYLVAASVAGYCGFAQVALDPNVLYLLLGLCGIGTANYAVTNANEVKSDKQSQD